ncbi:hypothetical protein JHK82_039863 [Glycine max]|uniref:Nuclear pore complex protein NUP85 n=2 Tax=Glycine subgen. Soja TaxID=1462606 RepID=A0A0R0GD43_SOYBN|nr:hypothetical protein JHK87_039858 [Glycine soja]KAG4963190.1 hypothetical protein JHK86_040058 [Glycine max]KAG4965661.1 hypothetical protein JHK85_040636 [Glycine max]KAG5110640.1 hypothetical protein JHK82_039863 [Glycine max]KAG5121929.1 hypothetical protein JHK84_040269 [Glycine max]
MMFELVAYELMSANDAPERDPMDCICFLWEQLKLLNWQECSLLSVSETNLLLNKLQELSLAKLRPHYIEPCLPPDALSSIGWL